MCEANFDELRELFIANFDTIVQLKNEKIARLEKQLFASNDERDYWEQFAKDMTTKAVALEKRKCLADRRTKQLDARMQLIIDENNTKDNMIADLAKKLSDVNRESNTSCENGQKKFKSNTWSASETIDRVCKEEMDENVEQRVEWKSSHTIDVELLNAKINQLTQQNEMLLISNEQISGDHTNLVQEIKRLKEQIEMQKTEEQIKEKNKMIESLEKQLISANERYELSVRFTQDMVQKAQTLEKLKTDFANKKWQLEVDLSSRVTHFQELIDVTADKQKEEISALNKRICSLLDTNKQLKFDLQKANRERHQLAKQAEDQKRQYEGSLSVLMRQNGLLANRTKQITTDNENTVKEMTGEMRGLKNQIDSLRETIKKLRDNNTNALQAIIKEKNTEIKALRTRTADRDSVVTSYEKLCSDHKKLIEEITQLKQQIANQNQRGDSAEHVNDLPPNIIIKQEIDEPVITTPPVITFEKIKQEVVSDDESDVDIPVKNKRSSKSRHAFHSDDEPVVDKPVKKNRPTKSKYSFRKRQRRI